jgi:hypothetical protein
VIAGCGGDDKQQDKKDAQAALSRQFARERRAAEKAVKEGKLPKEALQAFDSHNRIQYDFTGKPGSKDVVKEDGKPDRNLRFDLDHDGKIEPGERRITEEVLVSALLRIVRPTEAPPPGQDSGKSS